MGRSKKGAFHSLSWRLTNPQLAKAADDDERRAALVESFDGEMTDAHMNCRACDAERVSVPASQVPPKERAFIERSYKIMEFVYCPACKTHSGFSKL